MEGFLASCIVAATPLIFATVGELFSEKAGHLNLGVEGMMLMGAVMGFMAGLKTGNPYMALFAAALAGAAGALIFAVLTVSLRANQVVTGLTLTIFGTGFASFVGQPMLGAMAPKTVGSFFVKRAVPVLGDIPFIGPILFRQDIFVYMAYFVVIVSAIYLYKTKAGLNLRAVGESSSSADASGINVTFYKYCHILMGGGLCGLGGAYLSLVRVPIWQADVVNGRGWIAVALVIFASWNPIKAFLGAILFGGLSILGLRLQAMGVSVSQYLVDLVPYLSTIVIVVISSYKKGKEKQPPRDLGNSYFREER